MTFVSYAQNFEDVLLWRVFGAVQNGSYIDIGAQDPVVDSVSLAFYEAGWRGIHIEPTPAYASRLREGRPDETVIEAVVSETPGPVPFFEFPDTGISTGREDVAGHHSKAGFRPRKILVPTVRLEQLLEMIETDVHWMKVDVEGMELDVLRSWGESKKRPWVLVIEATYPSTQERTDHLWRDEVVGRGYKEAFFDGLSCYFVHESHQEVAERFGAPANVFDAFAVARHHFSASQMREEQQTTSQRLDQEWARAQQLTAELHESRRAREMAHEELKNALEWRAAAEQERRTDLEKHAQSLQAAEELHRHREEALRQTASEAQAEATLARIDAARFTERASQLQERLADAQQDAAEARSRTASAEHERNEAREVAQRMRTDLEAQIGGLQVSLAKAKAVIAAAAAASSGRWQRIGEALGFARPLRPRLAEWDAFSAERSPISRASYETAEAKSRAKMINAHSVDARNPYLRANSLAELLSWADLDFVRCAYVTVLGRQPDPDGETYYLGRIREGHSKLQVLWQLRKSNEGPRHDPGIAGFDRALKKARWERGWFGWLIRPFTGGEGDGASWRRHRVLLNALERNTIQIASIGDQLFSLQMELHPSASAMESKAVDAVADQTGSPSLAAEPSGAQFLTARERMFYLRFQA